MAEVGITACICCQEWCDQVDATAARMMAGFNISAKRYLPKSETATYKRCAGVRERERLLHPWHLASAVAAGSNGQSTVGETTKTQRYQHNGLDWAHRKHPEIILRSVQHRL
jgi:hypothetical protein